MFDLRAWLRRAPKPRKLRLLVNGEERIVDLAGQRQKWAEVEQTVRTAGASAVECLDEAGATLRGMKLTDDDGDADSDEDARDKFEVKMLTRDHAALAMVLDRYGDRIARAYDAGARASAISQENLVAIVETLTAHLSLAITNLHNISTSYANVVAASGGEGGDKNEGMMMLLSALSGRLPAAAVDASKKNGAK